MAKVIPSALVDELRGSLGGSTFRTNKAGIHVYPKQRPRRPNSPAQSKINSNFSSIVGSWSKLTETQKSLWNKFASLSGRNISGYNSFVSLNANILNSNYSSASFVDTPPIVPATPPSFYGLFAQEFGGTSTNVCWSSPDNSLVNAKCYITKVDGSKLSWRLFDTVSSNDLYANHNYNYPAGTVVQYRARSILEDGTQGPYIYSPQLKLPINVLFFGDVGGGKIKGLYLDPLSYAFSRYSDDFSSLDLGWIYGVSIDDNYIYFIDHTNGCLYQANKFTFEITNTYTGYGGDSRYDMSFGEDLCVYGDFLYVIVSSLYIVKIQISTWTPVGIFDSTISGPGSFAIFKGICVCNDNLFVSSGGFNTGVYKIGFDLTYSTGYFSYGSGVGEFSSPYGLDSSGSYVYVADAINNKIIVISENSCDFSSEFTSLSGDPLSFDGPIQLLFVKDYCFLSDYHNNRIVKFDPSSLTFLEQFQFINSDTSYSNGVRGLAFWQE